MIQSSIARRYARALFESVGTEFEQAGAELGSLVDALERQPEILALLADPTASGRVRAMLETLITEAHFHPMTANLLRLLGDRGRVSYLAGISAAFGELVDQQVGRLHAEVTSAEPLAESMAARLGDALSSATGKKVEVATSADSSLLGGVVAKVGNLVYDGSLRTQLEHLRQELLGEGLHR